MVNLKGAFRGLGVGLAYLGQQGLEQQQRVDADRRLLDREMAMQAIRQRDALASDDIRRDRDIRTDEIKGKEQFLQQQATTEEITEPARVREADRTQRYQTERDERTYQRQQADQNEVPIDTFQRDVGGELHMIHVYRGGRQVDMGPVADAATRSGRDSAPPSRRNGQTGNYEEYRNGQWVDTGTRFPASNRDPDNLDLDNEDDAEPSVGRTIVEAARRPTLTPRTNRPRERVTVRPGQTVRDANGNYFIIQPDGSRRPTTRPAGR